MISDKHILDLTTPEGFEKAFYEHYKPCYSSDQRAYEALKRFYVDHFGRRRYSSWECFKEIKNRKNRKKH